MWVFIFKNYESFSNIGEKAFLFNHILSTEKSHQILFYRHLYFLVTENIRLPYPLSCLLYSMMYHFLYSEALLLAVHLLIGWYWSLISMFWINIAPICSPSWLCGKRKCQQKAKGHWLVATPCFHNKSDLSHGQPCSHWASEIP